MAKPRLLVVDDDPNIRNALNRWFQMAGFEVTLACDGVAAVEACEGSAFDVVTMDLEMPRMDGIEATRRIKSLQPGTSIVILTGFHAEDGELADSGAARVVRKPVSMRDLEQVVREVLPHESAP